MNLTFIQTPLFVKLWKERYELTDEDLRHLEEQMARRPAAGPVVKGLGGVRKVRFAAPSESGGKSGGYRVGYIYMPEVATVFLVILFAKSEQPNFTPEQERVIRHLAEAAKASVNQARNI